MRAFVIRPFRAQDGLDFNAMHEKLIAPALAKVGATGGTTALTIESSSIHHGMFREILEADLVIADVSIHNANVFYELGIRHALRANGTVLLRAAAKKRPNGEPQLQADVPFDIHGFRYVNYNPANYARSIDKLVDSIRETLASNSVNSPVFRAFPGLEVTMEGWSGVPLDLHEEIDELRVSNTDESRAQLRLLADDVRGLQFEIAALRLIGNAQVDVGDRPGARSTWEYVRSLRPYDYEANHRLATIYAKLRRAAQSEQAIDRALVRRAHLTNGQRAELHGLRASNMKTKWMAAWNVLTDVPTRQVVALNSDLLPALIEEYIAGVRADLGAYYSSLNALAMCTVQLALIEAQPETWCRRFASAAAADEERQRTSEQKLWLHDITRHALHNARDAAVGALRDEWLGSSFADLAFLTQDDDDLVAARYDGVVSMNASIVSSVKRQLGMFSLLELRQERCDAAIRVIDQRVPPRTEEATPVQLVVFAGHTLDSPDRTSPRFPQSSAEEVQAVLNDHVQRFKAKHETFDIHALGGPSDGGDLAFHRAFDAASIPTELFLPYQARPFGQHGTDSVPVSANWISQLLDARQKAKRVHLLDDSNGLPSWTQLRRGDSTWDRWQRWILHHAQVRLEAAPEGSKVTVMLLWDGLQPADGYTGGVFGMAQRAQAARFHLDVIDMAGAASGRGAPTTV
jgi:hypothetical protein